MTVSDGLFIANGVLELLPGMVVLFLPHTLFPGANSTGTLAATWWAASAAGLGIASLLVVGDDAADKTKTNAAILMMFYHEAVMLMMLVRTLRGMQVCCSPFSCTSVWTGRLSLTPLFCASFPCHRCRQNLPLKQLTNFWRFAPQVDGPQFLSGVTTTRLNQANGVLGVIIHGAFAAMFGAHLLIYATGKATLIWALIAVCGSAAIPTVATYVTEHAPVTDIQPVHQPSPV